MDNNIIAGLILLGAYLFVVPLFLMEASNPFLKEYFKCVGGLGILLAILITVLVVVSAIWWSLGTLLGID